MIIIIKNIIIKLKINIFPETMKPADQLKCLSYACCGGKPENVILRFDLECMVNFYKGILNKTYIYILINSVV